MFGHAHYLPLLRLKPAEIGGLGHVAVADREMMTPMFEMLPKDFEANKDGVRKPTESVIEKRVGQIFDAWIDRFFYIDTAYVLATVRGSSGRHVLESFCDHSREVGCSPIPVIRLNATRRLTDAARNAAMTDNHGVCLRVNASDISSAQFSTRLRDLVSSLGLVRSEIDIVVDAGFIGDSTPRIDAIVSGLPNLNDWRSLTFLAGSFPKDLSGFSLGEHTLTRTDWISWREFMLGQTRLSRRPAFGDYTIQHGIYSEPPPVPNFSASIRYTTDVYWVIMRGESAFKEGGPGFAQWPANAQMLVDRSEFAGREYCVGDQYIYEMANQTKRNGSAATWLKAGINRHLTSTSRQIASFFGVAAAT